VERKKPPLSFLLLNGLPPKDINRNNNNLHGDNTRRWPVAPLLHGMLMVPQAPVAAVGLYNSTKEGGRDNKHIIEGDGNASKDDDDKTQFVLLLLLQRCCCPMAQLRLATSTPQHTYCLEEIMTTIMWGQWRV
jgi:hypothetical protein